MADFTDGKRRAGIRIGAGGAVRAQPGTLGAELVAEYAAGALSDQAFMQRIADAASAADAAYLSDPFRGMFRPIPEPCSDIAERLESLEARLERPAAPVEPLVLISSAAFPEQVEIKACKKPGEVWTPAHRAVLFQQFQWLTKRRSDPLKAYLADEELAEAWNISPSNVRAQRLLAARTARNEAEPDKGIERLLASR